MALAVAAGGGYAAGAAGGEDLDAARTAGNAAGTTKGQFEGERAGRAAGLKAGRRRGYRETYRRAYGSGYRRGREVAGADDPVPATGQPTSCADGLVSAANGCVRESEAVCAAYQDFVPGEGCVPPLKPNQIEAEPNCPPDQVAVGVTGACARP